MLTYVQYKGYTKRKIYLDTGMANGVLDKETGLSEKNIELFLSTYTEVNPTWLLTGKGNMLNTTPFEKDLFTDKKVVDIIHFLTHHEDELMQHPIYKKYIQKLVDKFNL